MENTSIPKEKRQNFPFQVGTRVRYTVPERGGWGYGWGKVLKVNKRSVLVDDEKYGSGNWRVDKELIFEVVKF